MSPSHSALPKKAAYIVGALSVAFFILGVDGHLRVGNTRFDSVYKSMQLFHLHYHPHPDVSGDAEVAHALDHTPITLQVSRFGTGLLAFAILPALIGLLFETRLKLWYARSFWSGHIVVFGGGHGVVTLIRILNEQGRRVFHVSHEPVSLDLPAEVRSVAGHGPLLASTAIHRAKYLVALDDRDYDNLRLILDAQREVPRRKTSLGPLECFGHLSETTLQHGLDATFIRSDAALTRSVRLQLFNRYDLVARILARQHPMPATLADSAPNAEHLVLVGFGTFGQRVALKLVKMGQQLYRSDDKWHVVKPKITVIDPRGEAAVALFLRTHPRFAEQCDFAVHALSSDAPAFIDLTFLNAGTEEPVSIVFCLEDEATALRSALLTLDACRKTPKGVRHIYLQIAEPAGLGAVVDSLRTHAAGPEIVLFGPHRELYSPGVLLNLSLDDLAEEIHNAYLTVASKALSAANRPPAARKTWRDLTEEDRNSNREAADHMWAKLAALGYRLKSLEAPRSGQVVDAGLLAELEARSEELARIEHYRWVTWRHLQGWQHGAVRDDVRRHHPDMVEFDALGEATKEKDRAIVHAIQTLLREGRLTATRIKAR